MKLWETISGSEIRDLKAETAKRQAEELAAISTVEAEGRYRTFLTARLSETWVCGQCGGVVANRALHDSWHA